MESERICWHPISVSPHRPSATIVPPCGLRSHASGDLSPVLSSPPISLHSRAHTPSGSSRGPHSMASPRAAVGVQQRAPWVSGSAAARDPRAPLVGSCSQRTSVGLAARAALLLALEGSACRGGSGLGSSSPSSSLSASLPSLLPSLLTSGRRSGTAAVQCDCGRQSVTVGRGSVAAATEDALATPLLARAWRTAICAHRWVPVR
jgi:hypothetical protein